MARSPILFHSNAPWVGTGYGTQSALFAPLLAEQLEHRVAFSAFYGLRGARLSWESAAGKPYVVYPGGRNAYGNDVLGAHSRHWFEGDPGIVIALTDPWVLDWRVCAQLPLASWVPIDHDPIMPRTDEWFARAGAIPIAMSRFGERMLAEAGRESVYVPHGFDPKQFSPLKDRDKVREALGMPKDAFIVGMVAANKGFPSRKGFSMAISAFAKFKESHPDAVLYLHTQLEEPDGENIPALCDAVKVRPMTSDPYGLALGAPTAHVGALMNAFDVLLNPSWGEGFGVPLIEAQACGTPCISTNFSSMPEVAPAEEGNWLIGGQKTWTPFDSWQMVADVDNILDALENAYDEPNAERILRRAHVAAFAHSEYTAEYVTETYWKPALEEIQAQLDWRSKRVVRGD